MVKLKNEEFNQLIIVVEYGKLSTDFYNLFEILENCLNGVLDSSVMLIINKVPNRAQVKRNLKEDKSFDLNTSLNKLRVEIARIFKFEISAYFSLVKEEENEDDLRENDDELEQIRNLIGFSEAFKFSNVKTWSELLKLFEESKKSSEEKLEQNNQFLSGLGERILKISLNISRMKSQLEIRNKAQSFVTDVNDLVAVNPIKHLIRPVVYLSKRMLERPIREIETEIEKLSKEKEIEEKRQIEITQDNHKLNEEIEKFSKNINRLQNILRNMK